MGSRGQMPLIPVRLLRMPWLFPFLCFRDPFYAHPISHSAIPGHCSPTKISFRCQHSPWSEIQDTELRYSRFKSGHWNWVIVCLPFPECAAANSPRNRLRIQPYLRSQPAALCPDTFPCMWKPIGRPAHCHHPPDWILRCISWFWICVDLCSILPNEESTGRHKNGVSMEVRSILMINKLFAEASTFDIITVNWFQSFNLIVLIFFVIPLHCVCGQQENKNDKWEMTGPEVEQTKTKYVKCTTYTRVASDIRWNFKRRTSVKRTLV